MPPEADEFAAMFAEAEAGAPKGKAARRPKPGDKVRGLITSLGISINSDANLGEADCRVSATGGAFLERDGSLQGARVAAIYGRDHPFLREEMGKMGGCAVFQTAQTTLPPTIKAIVHYTGYAP